MKTNRTIASRIGEFLLPALVLGLLLLYTYARFYLISYVGFQYNANTGQIVDVHPVGNDPTGLRVGDRVLAIDGIPWEQVTAPHAVNPLAIAEYGDLLRLELEGENGHRQVMWTVPGFNASEFWSRFLNTWMMSYVFWLAGTATLLLVRPKDLRWSLLVAFNYITAIWLIAGNNSGSGVLEAGGVLRAGIWASIPVYVHLQWNFPRPLGKIPRFVWITLYGLAIAAAIAQWAGFFDWDAHLAWFGLAVLASVAILALRFAFRKTERREIGLLFFAGLVALLPAAAIAISSLSSNPSLTLPGYLLSILALPGAYFYVVYRRQLGGLEYRANRLISLYLFFVLLVTFSLLVLPLVSTLFAGLSEAGGAIVFTAILASLVTVFGFERFQHFVERTLLRIPEPPQHVLEGFASRISTSFSREHLATILEKDVLPSFLVRQSMVMDFDAFHARDKFFSVIGLEQSEMPSPENALKLARDAQIPLSDSGTMPSWVRASLVLSVSGKVRGVWLLGRKDPDDFYSQSEVNLLRSLADQMAIALANISQADSLRALHQADIERQEVERVHLARELHDDTLRRVRELPDSIDDAQYAKGFGTKVEGLITQIRALINGLRPPMLDQGLYYALQDLTQEMQQKAGDSLLVHFGIADAAPPFDPAVEQHIYRIVQQACENALQHAKATHLSVLGRISESSVELSIEDDGVGLDTSVEGGLAGLLAARHFGLAGMHERAAMIGADLRVESGPGGGTRVQLTWRKH